MNQLISPVSVHTASKIRLHQDIKQGSEHGKHQNGNNPCQLKAGTLPLVDNIDARINSFNMAFERENVEEGGWSQYDRILERQFYNHGLIPEE